MIRCNPPWSATLLNKHWPAIYARVGTALMPVATNEHPDYAHWKKMNDYTMLDKWAKKKYRGFKEYGSGHYGVVMPTNTPGIVCKVTTDASEAAFIAAYLSIKTNARPNGIVRYHQLFALPETSKGRPVFILWRDEATAVGVDDLRAWVRTRNDADYLGRSLRIVERNLGNCLDAGREIRKRVVAVEKRHGDPIAFAERAESLRDRAFDLDYPPSSRMGADLVMAWHMNTFKQCADDLMNEPMGIEIGRALGEMMDMGMLLADVHLNNIGLPTGPVLEEVGETPIVTDPGHAIPLNRHFEHVRVERL
jgi:hypothetical protein